MTSVDHIDIRTARCLDGLHYSFQLMHYYYTNLYESCCKIPEDNGVAIEVLARIWGFVDTVHRLREIACAVPRVSSKHLEMRIFLSDTKIAEEYRHYIQHLRGELAHQPSNTYPVWGSLSWVDPIDYSKCHVALWGTLVGNAGFSSCVFDRLERKWVSRVSLSVGNKSFHFDSIYRSVCRFENFILPHSIDKMGAEMRHTDRLPIVSVQFRLQN
jgi:hypothetical protein